MAAIPTNIDAALAQARERNANRGAARQEQGHVRLRNKDFDPEFRVEGMHYFAPAAKARELGVATIELDSNVGLRAAVDTFPVNTGTYAFVVGRDLEDPFVDENGFPIVVNLDVIVARYHGGIEKFAEDLRVTTALHDKDHVGNLADAISARTSSPEFQEQLLQLAAHNQTAAVTQKRETPHVYAHIFRYFKLMPEKKCKTQHGLECPVTLPSSRVLFKQWWRRRMKTSSCLLPPENSFYSPISIAST